MRPACARAPPARGLRGRSARAAARQHVLEAAQRAVEEEAAGDSDGSQEAAGGDAAPGAASSGPRAGGPLPGEPAGACARVTILDGCTEARACACGAGSLSCWGAVSAGAKGCIVLKSLRGCICQHPWLASAAVAGRRGDERLLWHARPSLAADTHGPRVLARVCG